MAGRSAGPGAAARDENEIRISRNRTGVLMSVNVQIVPYGA